MKSTSFLDTLSEAFDQLAFATLLFPAVFPIIALLDGAQAEYMALSAFYAIMATFGAGALMSLFSALSAFFYDLSSGSIRREQDAKAFASYLLNGGKV